MGVAPPELAVRTNRTSSRPSPLTSRSGNELFIVLQKTFVIIWDDVWCILYFILELEFKSGQIVGLPTDGKSWDKCCLNASSCKKTESNVKLTNWTESGTIWSKNQHDYESHQTLIQQTLYCWYQNMTPTYFLMFLLGSTGRTRLWSDFCWCRAVHVFWKISMSQTEIPVKYNLCLKTADVMLPKAHVRYDSDCSWSSL